MINVTVAKVDSSQRFNNVNVRHFEETDYTNILGFVFHRDRENNPVVTFMHKNGCEGLYKFDDLAYIAFDTVPDETLTGNEAIENCKAFCLDQIKEHELDPFKTEIFYCISGYVPFLTILEVRRIVDGLREYVINQLGGQAQ